jgi:hypothetical protein
MDHISRCESLKELEFDFSETDGKVGVVLGSVKTMMVTFRGEMQPIQRPSTRLEGA